MATSQRPLCPDTPRPHREPRPHRDVPPRPPSVAKPFIGRAPWQKPPGPKWAPGEYEKLRSIIDEHRAKRRAAIETIKHFRSQSRSQDVNEVVAARNYLEHWREQLRDDIVRALPDIDPKYHELLPKPANPADYKARPAGNNFEAHVAAFRAANAQRIAATPTAELRVKYHASRVMRLAPDILAVMPLLDNDDAARAMIALRGAYDILKHELKAQDTPAMIEAMMGHPRLPDPHVSEAVMAEADALHEADPPGTPHPTLAPDYITTNRDWMERTAARINHHIGNYMRDHRWDIIGSFMGMLTTELDSAVIPALTGDAEAIATSLSAQTAVLISLLKTGLVPDHTDDEEGAILWWETLELYAEEEEIGEIPAGVIVEVAKLYGLQLLKHAPQPTE